MTSSLGLPDTWLVRAVAMFVMLLLMARQYQAPRVLVLCIRGQSELLHCTLHIGMQTYILCQLDREKDKSFLPGTDCIDSIGQMIGKLIAQQSLSSRSLVENMIRFSMYSSKVGIK
jgi:hypothetical protein